MTNQPTAPQPASPEEEHPYHVHVRHCESCSSPYGHCSEGLRLLRAPAVAPQPAADDLAQQARELVKELQKDIRHLQGDVWPKIESRITAALQGVREAERERIVEMIQDYAAKVRASDHGNRQWEKGMAQAADELAAITTEPAKQEQDVNDSADPIPIRS